MSSVNGMSEQSGPHQPIVGPPPVTPNPDDYFPGISRIQGDAIIEHLKAIRGWVGFMGAVVLLGVIIGVLVAFGVIGETTSTVTGY